MAARQKDFSATEIKAGALVLISFVLLILFMAAVRGCRPSDDSARVFHASFTDISGLNIGAPVRFGGVQVGRVVGVVPDEADRSRIRVTAEVSGGIPVNEGSVASIGQVTLTAEKHFEISTGDSTAPLIENGGILRARAGGGGMFDMPDLEGVIVRLEELADGVNALVGVDPAGGEASEMVSLSDLLKSLETTADETSGAFRELRSVIGENREQLQAAMKRLVVLEDSATELLVQLNEVVAENREPLHESVVNLQDLLAETATQIDGLATTLQSTLKHFEEVGGNANDLLDARRPTIEEILVNLEDATRDLKEFARVIGEQPAALIRGREPEGRKSGEGQ